MNISSIFEIVFENENFIAINKETNLSTDRNTFYSDSVQQRLESLGKPYSLLERCGIVHRIDRDTTGLLLIAKNYDYQEKLQKMFKEKKIRKFYLSLNIGKTETNSGSIRMFLKKSFPSKKKLRMVIDNSFTNRFVELNFKKLSFGKNLTLFKVEAITGKTHQIRIGFESINLPIYNDSLYNKGVSKDFKFSEEGHYLHSYMLKFSDGKDNFKIIAKAPSFFTDKIRSEEMLVEDEEIKSLI